MIYTVRRTVIQEAQFEVPNIDNEAYRDGFADAVIEADIVDWQTTSEDIEFVEEAD